MNIKFLPLFLFVLLIAPRPTAAATIREQFKASVAELQKNPGDKALREKIIKLALKLKPKPAVPKEARRRMARGRAAVKAAEDQDGFKEAVQEFEKAALSAPWLAQAYYNLGVVQDKAGDYPGAIASLKLYLLAAPGAKNAAAVEEKMFEIEYRMEKAGKDAEKVGRRAGEWVRIPGGTFMMGSVKGDDSATWEGHNDERPLHRVSVNAFQMAKTEVTNKQYQACVEAGVCTPPSCLWGSYSSGGSQPVACVVWKQADTFAKWVGGRLPTEAEWEYAARSAGKYQKFPWGNRDASCSRVVMNEGCGRKASWPVCSKTGGNTEQGLCDMLGNVFEFVQDAYHRSYDGAPTDGSAWESPGGPSGMYRGGSWYRGTRDARAPRRVSAGLKYSAPDVGFRVARSK